jgi:hypothetical protein
MASMGQTSSNGINDLADVAIQLRASTSIDGVVHGEAS